MSGSGRPFRVGPFAALAVLACGGAEEGSRPDNLSTVVTSEGVSLAYVERGRGSTVVLVHGSLADYTYWQQSGQISRLSLHHRVFAYSRRYNHPNRNELRPDHSPIVEAADLAHLLDVIGPEPVHLVGHSYGAYTALAFALAHPERVRSLVLAEPPIISWLPDIAGGSGIYEAFLADVWAPLGRAFEEGGTAGGLDFTAHWYFGLPFTEIEPEWQDSFARNVVEWRALAVSAATYPKLDYAALRELRVPTLVLSAGQNEGGFNDLIDEHIVQLIPGAERVILADVSHEMFLDDPEGSAGALLEFFRRH